MGKIARALRDVRRYVRCAHEFTRWSRLRDGMQSRRCPKCEVTEWRVAKAKPQVQR